MALAERIKRRKAKRLWKTAMVLFWVGVLGLSFWAAFYSPIFLIKTVVADSPNDTADQILKLVEPMVFGKKYGIFNKNHPLFVEKKFIVALVTEHFNQLGDVNVKYDFFKHALVIAAEPRLPVAHWCSAGDCYLIDRKGIIYAPAGQGEGSLILTIRDETRRSLKPGVMAVPEAWMEFFSVMRDRLRPIVWVAEVILEEESIGAHYVRLKTADGWSILVDTDMQPQVIVDELEALVAKELKGKTGRLDYVDLRIAGRAYYRLR